MNRVTARAHAMKLIYEWELGGQGGEETHVNLLGVQPGEEEYAYMQKMVKGVIENAASLDERIEQSAHGWTVERMTKVDLAILRLGAYELQLGETPVSPVINAAIELAREFSTEKAPQFINGVLGSIARSGEA